VNPYLNASDAFVAAWLPGSEGEGVADLLFGKADFRGKLPYSWPKRPDQAPLNVGDPGYDPLFAYGFGLSTRDKGDLAPLPENRGTSAGDRNTLFARGKPTNGRHFLFGADGALSADPDPALISARSADRGAQEDSVRIVWTGKASATAALAGEPVDLTREANGDVALVIDLKVDQAPTAPVLLGGRDVTARLTALAASEQWDQIAVPLRCLVGTPLDRVTQPLTLATAGRLDLTISAIRFASPPEGVVDCR
jgi:beta-glucosidase